MCELDEQIHNHTLAEEYLPPFLDEVYPLGKPDTGCRVYFGRLAAKAFVIYNKREGTSFEFVEVEK
ncbi:unnamed protein product [Eruca vesicaria subsp. sativa]|uniref:Uncharacterized protein n=1 Tax=Eruca vesicaria subsp. sativa TaxID=29727 RepID=A0ABC8LDP9_ERUVS|nr:unnamed protein product [Eruca vesicaria subsp. sativa]